MSEVWDDLTDVSQANLTELLGGKRNSNVISALMNNFDTAREVVQTSLNAEGSAVKENEKYLESVSGKITEMKSQFQVLSSTVVNSDVLKFFIDIATGAEKVVTAVAKVSNSLGSFGTILSAIGIAKFTKGIASAVKQLGGFETIAGATTSKTDALAQTLSTAFPKAASKLSKTVKNVSSAYSAAGGGLSGVVSGVVAGISTQPILAAVAALGLLATAIHYVATSGERANQAVDTAMSSYSTAKTNLDSVNSELETAKSSMDELLAKDSLTFVEQGELQNLKDTVEQLTIAADLAKVAAQQEAKSAAKSAVEAFNENFEEASSDSVQDRLDEYDTLIDTTRNYQHIFTDMQSEENDLTSKIASIKYAQGLMDDARKEMDASASEMQKYSSDTSSNAYKSAKEAYDDAKERYDDYKEAIDTSTDSVFTNQVKQLQAYRDAINAVTESGATLSTEQQTALKSISSMIDLAYESLRPDEYKQMKFDELFSDKKLSNAKSELINLAKETENVGITVDDIKSKYPELADAIKDTDFSLQDVVDQINSEAGVLNLDEIKAQLKEAFNPELDDNSSLNELSSQWNDWISGLDDNEIELLYSIKKNNDTDGWDIDDWKDALESSLTSAYSEASNKVSEMKSELTSAITSQNNITEAIKSSNTTAGLSADQISALTTTYKGLEVAGAGALDEQKILNNLFTKTASGVRLNTKAMESYNSALETATKKKFADSINEVQESLNKAVDEKASQSVIDGLNTQLTQLKLLSSEYDGATSKFQKWVDAQSSANAGDNYRDLYDATTSTEGMIAQAEKLYSEYRTNTDDFRAAASYFSYEDLTGASQEAVESAWEKSADARDKYFTGTADGINAFMKDLAAATDEAGNSMGWAELDENGKMNFAGKIDDIAKYFGVSTDAINDILSAASEYNDSINLEDTASDLAKSMENTKSFAKTTSDSLNELTTAAKTYTNTIDSSAIAEFANPDFDASTASVDEFKAEIERLNGLRVDVEADADTEEGQAKLEAFDSYVESLENQSIALAIQTEIEGGTSIDDLLGMSDAELADTLQIDISTDTSQLDTAKSMLESMKGETVDVPVTVKLDESQFSQLTGTENMTVEVTPHVNDAPQVPDGDMNVTANVTSTNPSPLTGEMQVTATVTNEPTVSGTANFTAGDTPSTVPAASGTANYELGTTPPKAPDITGTVNYSGVFPTSAPTISGIASYSISMSSTTAPTIYGTAVYTKTIKPGSTGTLTSARADGTAYNTRSYRRLTPSHASGQVSLSRDERALVNELGTESIIRNGVWSLLPGKMHIQDLKKGDIILNAQQTKDLLTHGSTNSHARSFAYGSLGAAPYVSGSWTPIPTTGRSSSSKSSSKKSSSSSSSSSNGTTYNYNTYNNYSSSGSSGSKSSSGSSSSSSSSSSSNSNDKDPEVIDWIEIAIDRIERAIDNLSTIATSSFRTLSEKLTATNDQLTKTAEEITLQQSAYSRYIQQADSVGLSSDLAEKVKNGTIDINEYDEDTADKIEDYQEWYEKALDCNDAILELNESLAELYQNKFDDVQTDYENQLSLLEHLTNTFNNGIDDLEERGYLASTKYYEALKSVENQNISVMKKELADLTKRMSEAVNSGSIAEGSEAWYEFQQSINEVKESIQESETALVEFSNSIREIKWDRFDYLQEQISNITEEADFLIDLMEYSDLYNKDNGQLTDTGLATMGLHGQNYNVYMAQADKYAEELLSLNKELAEDPNNTKLLDRQEELLESQRDAILAAEDEKDAIIDMVKDGIEYELDALQDLIDKYTDSLDSAKDLYDYQKKLKDQTSEIATLQKQLSAYAGDTSEENKATVQKIKVDLQDAMDDLEETQYEHYISEQKQLLDNLYDEYETILNERLDNIDALMADMIDRINSGSSSICDTLMSQADKVGYTITDNEKAIWSNEGGAFSIVTKYGESFLTQMTTVNDVISKIAIKIGAMTAASEKKAETTVKKTTKSTATDKSVKPQTSKNNTANNNKTTFSEDVKRGIAAAIYVWGGSGSGWGDDPQRKQRLTEKFGAENAKAVQDYINAHYNDNSLYDYWVSTGRSKLSQYYYSAYKKGGLADYTGVAWLDGTPSDPEMVLSPSDTSNFIALKDAMRAVANSNSPLSELFNRNGSGVLNQLVKSNGILPNSSGTAIGDITYQINIPIDHVQDYEDFMNQMRQDGKFEKMIQSMTVDRLVGGSKISKNKYKW